MLTLGPPEKSLGPRGSPDHTLRTAAFTNAALPWGKAAFRHGAGIPPQSNSRMVCGVHAHLYVHTYWYRCKHGRGKTFVLISHVVRLSMHTHMEHEEDTVNTEVQEPP